MSIADKLQTILENEQKVYKAGYEKGKSEGGGSGEKPTLFTPSIALQSVTSVLTITDNRNGDFVQGYNIYANDNLITVSTSKEVTLTDYIEHTETIDIKVQATSTMFNSSEYSNIVEWKYYAPTTSTIGLAYKVSDDGTYAICTGKGDAVEKEIVIGSSYSGKPVTRIENYAFNNAGLRSAVIPQTVTSIGVSAFRYCGLLKRVDFSNHTSVPTLESSNSFSDTHSTLQIKVPASLIDSWKSATNWSNYASKIVTEFTNAL